MAGTYITTWRRMKSADEKRGIAKFIELLRKHGLGPVYEPKFVS